MPPVMISIRMCASLLLAALALEGCGPRISAPVNLQIGETAQSGIWVTATPLPPPSATSTRAPDPPPPTPTAGLPVLTDDELQNQLSHMAAGFMKSGRNPGLSVAIVKRNSQTGAAGAMLLNFGTMAEGGGGPIDSNTVYEIGSLTKLFTGILLAQGIQSGSMRLDDPIQAYMPSGVHAPDYNGIPITLGELASHRSGLPRDLNSDSLPELYAWLNGLSLSQAPGSEYIYSNAAYALLGDILARNAGTDYGTLVFDSVSQPLGLRDTTEVLTADQDRRLGQGYAFDGSLARYFPDAGAMSGAGYLHSTLNDMTRFLLDNLQPASAPLAASLSLAQQPVSEGRNPGTGTGLGWEVEQVGKPGEHIWKAGATPGFSSYISLRTDGSSGFVLLSNGQSVDALVPIMARLAAQGGN